MQDRDWYNVFVSFYSHSANRVSQLDKAAIAPLYIGYKITETCNQNCIHCWAGKSNNEKSFNEIKQAFDKLAHYKPYSLTISGGEPFCHKDCLKIIEYAVKLFNSVEIFSNAELIDEETAHKLSTILRKTDYIQVSFDGTKETYLKQRGKDSFALVVNNIKRMIKYGLNIRLHMTVTEVNVDNIFEVYNNVKQIKPAVFSITCVYPLRRGKKLRTEKLLHKYQTYLIELEKLYHKEIPDFFLRIFYPIEIQSKTAKLEKQENCIFINTEVLHWTITASGDIYNFMDHYEFKELKIGNIYRDDLTVIDKSNKNVQLKILFRDLNKEKCSFCSILDTCRGGDYISNFPDINRADKRCLFNVHNF